MFDVRKSSALIPNTPNLRMPHQNWIWLQLSLGTFVGEIRAKNCHTRSS